MQLYGNKIEMSVIELYNKIVDNVETAVEQRYSLFTNLYRNLQTGFATGQLVADLDDRFIDPNLYKPSKIGVPYMDWCILTYDSSKLDKRTLTQLYNSTTNNQSIFKTVPISISGNQPNTFRNIFDGAFMLHEVKVNVNRPFNIVETKVKGLDGSVQEYVGAGDISINMQAVFVGPTFWQTDTKMMTKFLEMIDKYRSNMRPLTIVHPELNVVHGITSVYLYDYVIDQTEYGNIRNITLQLKKYNPITLYKSAPIVKNINKIYSVL